MILSSFSGFSAAGGATCSSAQTARHESKTHKAPAVMGNLRSPADRRMVNLSLAQASRWRIGIKTDLSGKKDVSLKKLTSFFSAFSAQGHAKWQASKAVSFTSYLCQCRQER